MQKAWYVVIGIIILIVIIVIILLLPQTPPKVRPSHPISRSQPTSPVKVVKKPTIGKQQTFNSVNKPYIKPALKEHKKIEHLVNSQQMSHTLKRKTTQPLPPHHTITPSLAPEKKLKNYKAKKIPTVLFPKTGWYLGIEGGVNYINQNSTKQTESQMVQHTFHIDSKFSGVRYGLMGGWTIARLTPNKFAQRLKKTNFIWFPAYHFGTTIWQIQNFTVTGSHTWQYPPATIPTPVNIAYHYDVAITAAEFQTIVDVFQWHRFTPFINLSIGMASVNMSNYQEDHKTVNGIPVGGWKLENADNTQLIYEIGLGIKYRLNTHWQMQLQYTYFPITIKTGKYWINQGAASAPKYFPALDHEVNMSSVLLGINYRF